MGAIRGQASVSRRVRWTALPAASLLAAVAIGVMQSGCDTGAPASPGVAPAVAPTEASVVGPAPLRRLSNTEYLNALHDLFPGVSVALPPLPSDVPVAGFENAAEGQAASDVRIARYEEIGNLYAEAAMASPESLVALAGCDGGSTDDSAASCASSFVDKAGARIFRRPVDAEEHQRIVARFLGWRGAIDFAAAAQLTLSAMLQAPQFLYRAEPMPPGTAAGAVVPVEPYALASRLSFFLWESTPDDALLDAAAHDALQTEDQVRAQAGRMLEDVRARRVFWDFHRQWLGLDRILLDEHTVRTAEVDPAWTADTPVALFHESQLFVENVLAGGGTFRDLLTSRRAWVNGEAARIYGLSAPQDANAWTETALPEAERSGLITRAAFLAGFSHRGATSPPVRGNGIQLRLLCRLPVSPPPGVDLSQPTAAPGDGPKTNRMLFETRTHPAMCQACHAGLNGFGFGLERYDAAGHFHTIENGLTVDASGEILGTDVDGPFTGGVELSEALARSADVQRCATERLVRYALGRAPAPEEGPAVAKLAERFTKSKGDLRALLVDVAISPSFRMQKADER